MNDLRNQLEQMQKMGGMQGLMGMMPGMAKMKGKIEEAGLDDSLLKRQIALINSMTKKERANPALLQASRKKRIATGSGMEVSDLNKLIKQHRQMADMMKKLGKRGGLGALKGMMGGKGAPSQAELAAAQEQITSGAMGSGMPKGMSLPKGMGGLSGLGGGLPGGLSGLGRKK
jgi:signal recognition particle subunit SRP54